MMQLKVFLANTCLLHVCPKMVAGALGEKAKWLKGLLAEQEGLGLIPALTKSLFSPLVWVGW